MDHFLFLFPVNEYFDFDIENGSNYRFKTPELDEEYTPLMEKVSSEVEKDKLQKEYRAKKAKLFRPIYAENLNRCMDERYRQNGFQINFVNFDNKDISDVIKLHSSDNILKSGINFWVERKEEYDDSEYADPDYILSQLGDIKHLRVSGFHMWDCVERVAKKAYENGINVLLDEDLTEFFAKHCFDPEFNHSSFPGQEYLENWGSKMIELFIEDRKKKPWTYQDYKFR